MAVDAAISTMVIETRITVIHDGETIEEIGKAEILPALKEAMDNIFSDEEVSLDKVSVLFKEFTYDDNIEALREAARKKLESLSPDELVEFMEQNNV